MLDREHQSVKPLTFGQNHPERVLFSSKQYKNTVYQNLNTMQPVGVGGMYFFSNSSDCSFNWYFYL